MGYRKQKTFFLLFLLSLMFINRRTSVSADGEGGSEEDIPVSQRERDLLQVMLGNDPADSAMPVYIADPSGSSMYQETFAMGENAVFSQQAETYTLSFDLPSYMKPRYVYAQVYASTLQEREEDTPASFTFFLNDEPMTAYRISGEQGKEQIYTILLPLETLREGENTFDIGAYVKTDENHTVDSSGWLLLKGATKVIVGYDLVEKNAGINDYPYPFVSTLDPTGSNSAVVLSEEFGMSAGLMLRGDLGTHCRDTDMVGFTDVQHASEYENTIALRKYDALDEEQRKVFDEAVDRNAWSGDDCVLVLHQTDNGTELLVVSDTEAGLENGVYALLHSSEIEQEGGVAIIKEETSDVSFFAREDAVTLQELNGEGLSFYGTLQNEQKITLPSANGAVLGENGLITLHTRYSENLDFERSLMTVYWGNVPIASRRMSAENAGEDTFVISIPKDVEGTWAEEITIRYDLTLPGETVERADRMPWAYVCDDSSFHLPLTKKEDGDLKEAGSLLLEEDGMVYVVVPEEMSEAETELLGQLASVYPDSRFAVVRADEIPENITNRILLGTGENNEEINRLKNTYQGLFMQEESAAGGMQLVDTEDGKVLLVWGETDEDIRNLNHVMASKTERKRIKNDTMLVNRNKGVQYTNMQPERVEEEIPPAEENEALIPWLRIAVGIGIFGLVLMFVRAGIR